MEADGTEVDELMELTAQSLTELEIDDRFDVIKEIGRGKYGRVLLVTHRCRGTPMALKVMPKSSTQLQGFLREYCTALTLSGHPSIVALFGIAFQSHQDYCFAQELTGRDLLSFIQPKVGLPEAAVKRCALQIASALEFIHGRGLVHRDVKPENVLLLDARCSRVKLADFGLAQRRGALIRFISGTLPYMSPELCARVLREGRVSAPPLPVEPSLDTWAFGVLLFCVLTGYFPWESCTDNDDFYTEFSDWSGKNGHQADGLQGDRSQADGHQADRNQGDRSQAEGHQAKGLQGNTNQADGHQANGNQALGDKADRNQEDGLQADGHRGDRNQALGDQANRNQEDGHQADGARGDRNQALGDQANRNQVDGQQADGHQGYRNHVKGDLVDSDQTDGLKAVGNQADGHEADGSHPEEEEVPSLWRRFSPDALQMFRRLLLPEAGLRGSVAEVRGFVHRDWLKQTPPTETTAPADQTPPPRDGPPPADAQGAAPDASCLLRPVAL